MFNIKPSVNQQLTSNNNLHVAGIKRSSTVAVFTDNEPYMKRAELDDCTQPLLKKRGVTILQANVNVRDSNGTTILDAACINGNDEIVGKLIENNAGVNVCDKDGNTPLHRAFASDNFDTVKILLKQPDVNFHTSNKYGFTPLNLACNNVVDLLIDNGVDINTKDSNGFTFLYSACANGYANIAKALIEKGVDVNATTKDGVTPLHLACEKGYESIFMTLIKNGAGVDDTNKKRDTSVHICVRDGHLELLLHLLLLDVDCSLKNNNNKQAKDIQPPSDCINKDQIIKLVRMYTEYQEEQFGETRVISLQHMSKNKIKQHIDINTKTDNQPFSSLKRLNTVVKKLLIPEKVKNFIMKPFNEFLD